MSDEDVEVVMTYSEDSTLVTLVIRSTNKAPISEPCIIDCLVSYGFYLKDRKDETLN